MIIFLYKNKKRTKKYVSFLLGLLFLNEPFSGLLEPHNTFPLDQLVNFFLDNPLDIVYLRFQQNNQIIMVIIVHKLLPQHVDLTL